ncbi:MAG TPA: twin-arginine translocase TatA/TatE family subunit [Beutenbergiaceae bacterium]|nr:twin-arginine translocase TatA/TatE family subunit [Beutenbergiaceae bacterium]
MGNFSGGEILIILFIALVLIGPERLPQYAEHVARFVKTLRQMMAGAKSTLKEELGDDYAELAKYDPRQYDPRRIVREALIDDVVPASKQAPTHVSNPPPAVDAHDGAGTTPEQVPFDDEAT